MPQGRHNPGSPERNRRRRWIVAGSAALLACVALVVLLAVRSNSDSSSRTAQTVEDVSGIATPTDPDTATRETAPPATQPGSPAAPTETTRPVSAEPWEARSTTRGRAGVDSAALALVVEHGLLPTTDSPDPALQCARESMQVSYAEPTFSYVAGAYAPPLGPEPTETTRAVNGVVVCATSTYSIMGFEAEWSDADGSWIVIPVPAVD